MPSPVKAEVIFMVYGQNGSVHIEKRALELQVEDYIACSSPTGREKLSSWAKIFFPSAKDVKIQGAKKIF